METTEIRVWTKEEIKQRLATNDGFVARSVVKLWERQTEDEKTCKGTTQNNGRGYNATDAEIMSSFAEYFNVHGRLSVKQLELARKKIMKYAGQIASIANDMEKEVRSYVEHERKQLEREQGI